MFSHWFSYILGTLFIFVQVVGAFCAIRAVFIARTPQATIAWIFGLIFVPIVTIPLFLIFGESRFSGYVCAPTGENAPLQHVFRRAEDILKKAVASFPPPFDRVAKMAEHMTSLPAVDGNSVSLLINGRQTFDAIFTAIDEAKNYLLVQFFVIDNDAIGRDFRERLLAAARRGVRIWVLYDAVGSRKLNESYLGALREAGIETSGFVTNRSFGKRFQLNFRNHRKLVLADGAIAFIGGHNVGDKYLGRYPRFNPWRDTHLKITGPIVQSFLVNFVEDWNYATGTVIHLSQAENAPTGSTKMFSLPSGPFDSISACHMVYLEAIHAARERLWIASPYYVPDFSVRAAIQSAALRGVDVRLILPQHADHLLPWLSSFTFYPNLRRAGVKVFRYQPGFMHQKVLLADNEFALVGSVNLDYRSFLLNFELTAGIHDSAFALEVEKMLLADFIHCKEEDLTLYENGSLFFRLKARLAALLSPEQ